MVPTCAPQRVALLMVLRFHNLVCLWHSNLRLKIKKGKKKMHTYIQLLKAKCGRDWKGKLPWGSRSSKACKVLGVVNTHKNGCSLASKPSANSWSCNLECRLLPPLPKATYKTDLGDCIPNHWRHELVSSLLPNTSLAISMVSWLPPLLATNTWDQLGW